MKRITVFMVVSAIMISLVCVGYANAELLFAATFDEGFDADVAAGNNPKEYYGELGLASLNPKLTEQGPAMWGESANYDADYLQLKYNALGNVDMQMGTLDFFLRIDEFNDQVFSEDYRHIFNIGGNNGLNIGIAYYYDSDYPRIHVKWNNLSPIEFDIGQLEDPNEFKEMEFNHIAVTWDMSGGADAGVLKLFVTGKLRGIATDLNTPTELTDYLYIGGWWESRGATFFPGYIDDVAIYDTLEYDATTVGDTYAARTTSAVPLTCEKIIEMGYRLQGDFNSDCAVDLVDLAGFANAGWLRCNDPADQDCQLNW